MHAIFSVTTPFFALVLLGYLAAQRRLLPELAIPGLNTYVLFFALPCLLFRFGASQPFASLVDPLLVGIYALCALAVVGLTVALTLRRRRGGCGVDLKNAAFGAFVAAFPNSGFMGMPLLVGLLGDAAAGPVIGTILVDLFLTSTVCLALAQAHLPSAAGSDPSWWAASMRALRGPLTNPQPWAIALGALLGASGWVLPEPAAQVVKMLGDSATPVALFTIGAVLWRAGQHAHTRTPVSQYLPVALIKLLVHPLLVLVAGLGARAAGLQVPAFGWQVLVLVAALPSASGVSLLAERFGADNGRVARIIMASTALAFVSFSSIAWALGWAGLQL
jgi:malonate transporter and related proteins